MSRMQRLLTAFLAVLVPAAAFPGPDFIARRFHGPTVRLRQVEGIDQRIHDGKLELRLDDFITLVLKNNTEIHLARLDVLTAADAVVNARAIFDPTLNLSFNARRTQAAQYDQTSGAEKLNTLYQQSQASYRQTFSTGQTLDFGFTGVKNSSNSQFVFYNPSITTGLNLGFTQPLLQNRNNLLRLAPLKIARTQLRIASDLTEARIADLVASAARQYWDAVQARDNIKVQQLAVDLAQKAYERDKLALELGALSSLEIYQSQSQVAQRRVALIQAQYAFRDALDGLRRLIGADLSPATRTIDITLMDDPAAIAPAFTPPPVDQAIGDAIERRPELKSVRGRYYVDDLNARVARNSMLPRFDLGVQVGGSGLGGNQIPASGTLGVGGSQFIPGGLGDSLSQTLGWKSPYYGFSLQLTLPVRSSAAEAGLADALVNKARDQYQQRQLEQQIVQDVKSAANQLEMGQAQIEAARTARDLAQKNVDAQQQKYEIGGITAFELLDAQNRLASVEGSLIAAHASYQKAVISYKRATWTLLDGLGVIVETPNVR